MAPKDGYEAIPDVETDPKVSTNPKDLYPDANDDEVKLLGFLDEIIQMPAPQIELPRLQSEQVGGPTSMEEVIEAAKLPTAAFVGIVTTAALVIWTQSPFLYLIFPYVACITMFLSIVPVLTNRFQKQSNRAFETLDKSENTVEDKVDAVTRTVDGFIDKVQALLNKVLEPIRPKLDKATKMEVILKKFDDDIDIPDPTDMEEELDGCTDKIEEMMAVVKGMIDFKKFIPAFLQSPDDFKMYIVYPCLAVFLVIQLIGVYSTQPSSSGSDDGGAIRRNAADNDGNAFTDSVDQVANSWHPIWVSILLFVTAIVQIVLAFLLTEAAAIAAVVNVTIDNVNGDANRAIASTGTLDVFEDVLTERMEKLKQKILKLIKSMNRIEALMAKAGLSIDINPMDSFKKFGDLAENVGIDDAKEALENVGKKAQEKLAEAHKEKIDDAKDAAKKAKEKLSQIDIDDAKDALEDAGKKAKEKFGKFSSSFGKH